MRLLLLIIVLGVFQIRAQTVWNFNDSARSGRIFNDISVLAHDSLMGRDGASGFEFKAGNYIIQQYELCGLIPVPGLDSFRQPFVLRTSVTQGDTLKEISHNILGYIENNAPYTIIIGGHYDHIGYVYDSDSLLLINNGADDNASGTAAVIEMARFLSSGNLTNYNYILACWGSEEQGLVGSNFFCREKVFPFDSIAFYVNFDMVGRLGWKENQLDIFGLGSSPVWKTIVTEETRDKFALKKFEGAVDASDHTCFYKNKIPYIYFTSGLPPVYHTPKDETPLINPSGVTFIVNYTEDIIGRFSGEKPSFRLVSSKEMNKVYWYFFSQMLN